MPDNPCKDCKCGSDGHPTNDCSEIMCDMIVCPEGQQVKYIPGTCCGQECVPVHGRLSMQIFILKILYAHVLYILVHENNRTVSSHFCFFVSDNVCNLPIEKGPCEAAMSAWGYNSVTGRCEHFWYGGCGGNGNNFDSEDNCIARCGKSGGPFILLSSTIFAVLFMLSHLIYTGLLHNGRVNCKLINLCT